MNLKKRTFQEKSYYGLKESTGYYLMPFNFFRINHNWEVFVNVVGDFLILPSGTAEKVINKDLSEEDTPELYADLVSNFFISETPVTPLIDVLAARYRTGKSFLYSYTSLHIFVVTLRCEHTCEYCQVSRVTQNKEAFDLEINYLEKGVDLMLMSPSKFLTMEFQGGEPLLAFDLIRYGVNYAKIKSKNTDKKINYVICTNLALINDEILAFCQENDILLSTSIDGPAFIHNQNRRRPGNNSFELLKIGLEHSQKVLGSDRVGALMTTSRLSLLHPIEIIDSYLELGFSNIFLRPISPYGFAKRNSKKADYETDMFLEFYKKGLEYILDINKRGRLFIEDYAAILLKKMFTSFSTGYVDLQSPAGAAISVVVFNYDGAIYATDESRMLAEMGDHTFKLGHLEDADYQSIFYGPKVQEIIRYALNENMPGCSDCAFQIYCGADPVYNYATQGSLVGHRPTNGFCKRNMEIIRYLFELMAEDKNVENIFRTWIN